MTDTTPPASTTHLVLIPSYNPGEQVFDAVRQARDHWNPVWVVVDGSTDGTGPRLQAMAQRDAGLRVIVLVQNQGKGAAVLEGLGGAAAAGFTHALTMDSDGQHPADSIPAFMAASLARRGAMVLGKPVFGPEAPALRVYGRKISNGWANLETLWMGIGDSLCGFRVYPIAPLIRIMRGNVFMRRFDFDPEAVVRLCWAGVRPLNIDVSVRYLSPEEGGVSHFKYLRDNGLLTWMHTRLFLGFLLRLPILVIRRLRPTRELNDVPDRAGALKSDPRLDQYFGSEVQRRDVTKRMFDQAAPGYDNAENLTSLGRGAPYRHEVLQRSGLKAGMALLDVAAGTGLVTMAGHALVGPSGRVWALDPSPGMLAELRKKVDVQTIEGYAESIALPDAQVDFVSMGYALRHVGDLDLAFAEYLRVLRPGGVVCIMEISRPQNMLLRALLRCHIAVIVPLLARLTGRHADVHRLWQYYGDTIEAAIEPEHILDALRRAGFTDVACRLTLGVLRDYCARKP